jgi:hypothetical protein
VITVRSMLPGNPRNAPSERKERGRGRPEQIAHEVSTDPCGRVLSPASGAVAAVAPFRGAGTRSDAKEGTSEPIARSASEFGAVLIRPTVYCSRAVMVTRSQQRDSDLRGEGDAPPFGTLQSWGKRA